MDIQFGPNSVDEPNLLYKLQHKIKVFNTNDPLPNRGYNLVASSSKYGLVFVAVPDGILTVYYLNQLVNKECEPQHISVRLQEKPTHVAVSCDHELLAITGGQLLCVYKVVDFQNSTVSPTASIRTEVNPSTFVSALQWNPCIPDSIAIAYYDGTLLACHISSGQMKKVPSKARCICWSPKGKQLVTGNSDGTLIQYKPDLTPAKIVPAPNLFEGCPVEALAIYWIATFQFAVVYKNATDNSRPAVTILNTPKAGQPSCINYEDICYSMGSNRPWYYYLQGLAQWNIILSSSSNSMEIATLASADGANWLQWCQLDEARPELPLTDKKQENYPVGICIDTCAAHQLPWGENETLPPMPLLHVVSQTGLLTTFNIINLNKDAAQVCIAPQQQLSLPAHIMTSVIPGEAPAEAQPAPVPAPTPKPEPQVSVIQQMLQSSQAPQQSNQLGAANVTATIKIPTYQPQANVTVSAAPTSQMSEQKPVVDVKPATISQAPATVPQPTPQQVAPPMKHQPIPEQTQENAAMKAEQERLNKIKANQELMNILVKEVNDFQMELYNFMVKTRETQARLQRDIENISANFNGTSVDAEQLKKECSIEELRGAIVQLKLELVRACAVVAEARTHSNAKDLHQWTQADPLTTKRVASVKKLAYYVQTQLEQAHKALDYKWNELASRDPQFNKPGKRMIRPILDDVYQPLVKQQEILSRQQAVLRALKSTLAECDIGPVFKSTSLLRSTPFKKDPLSKLTKNILNMSIEPQTKPKQTLLSAQKLDALRDVLSNHKTVRIKPVNVELRQHLAAMRLSYEKSLKEKAKVIKTEPHIKPPVQPATAPPPAIVKIEPKPEPMQRTVAAPAFTPVNVKPVAPGLNNVARTLFTDEPKQEPPKPQPQIQPFSKAFGFSAPTSVAQPAAVDTKSVLKDLLQNKQANLEAKNNSNIFMDQKICSPTAFAQSSAPTPASAPSAVFTSKPAAPISDIMNMFNKLQPQPFVSETKPASVKPTEKPPANVKSSETGEPEDTAVVPKPFEFNKDKPITNLFGMKSPLSSSSSNVPDVLKSSITDQKENKVVTKSQDKVPEKTKENVPEKSSENIPKTVQKTGEKNDAVKPLSAQTANKSYFFGASQPSAITSTDDAAKPLTTQTATKSYFFGTSQPSEITSASASPTDSKPLDLKTETKAETKVSEKSDATVTSSTSPVATSASASKPQSSAFTIPTSTPSTVTKAETTNKPSESESKPTEVTTSSATSLFGTAAASQPKTTSSVFSSSSTNIFSSTPQVSAFGTTKPSIFSSSTPAFGSTTTASSVFGQTSTTQSVFSSSAASVFASAASSESSALTTTTTSSVFTSTPIATPAFEATSTTASVFGSSATTTASGFGSTSTSVFGTATTSTPTFGATTTSVFGTTTPSTQASVFGSTTSAISSVFGTTPANQTSVFGSTTTTPSAFTPTTTSVFGTATTTASIFATASTQASSVFGQAGQSVFGATTQSSIFGGAQTSVFGSSSQTSVFGSPTPTTQASVFGTPTQSTQASIFGTPTPSTQASVFGSPSQGNQGSVFGTPTQTTQTSVFGTPTSQSSIFGSQPATTAQGGSLFGGGEANLFAAASISTTTAQSPGSGGNIFGGSSSGSVFGGGSTNVFGAKSTFGQSNNSAAAIFGGGAAFGQKPATNFWGSGGNTTGGFGSSGFGQQATTQASSIFGSSTGGSFSAPSAGAFGSPQQTSAFGSPQQQTPAFGGSPVFGSKPVFGQSSGFGSPTSSGFGGPAAFGGFNKSPGGGFGAPAAFGGGTAFGGSSPGGGFGSPTQSNATFESLATQNTLTFGNLAQQSGQPQQQAAPSFNTSPSFTGWRG